MERVAYVAALGAAVSVAALGYAVMWGVDLSEPPPAEVVAAPPPQAPLPPLSEIRPEAQRPPVAIVFAPPVPPQDAARAGSALAHVGANSIATDRVAAEPPAADGELVQEASVPPPAVAAPVALPEPGPVVPVPPAPIATPPARSPQAAIAPAPAPRVVRPRPPQPDPLAIVRGATPDAGPRLVQPGALIIQLPPRR